MLGVAAPEDRRPASSSSCKRDSLATNFSRIRADSSNQASRSNVAAGLRTPELMQYAIGSVGYSTGPGIHILDLHGLSDPLLARLPAQDQTLIIPGHVLRAVPPGYLETLRSGKNVIKEAA
jgi:hypothetical protein